MDLQLDGLVAVVTGGTRGIGRGIAIALAQEGARVAICGRTEETLAEAAAAAGGAGRALPVRADVTTEAGVAEVVARTVGAFGQIDLLVNNVGGSGARHFDDADEKDFRQTFDQNFWPALRMSKAVLPEMRKRGGGAILMISSIWGREAGGAPGYNTAKAAEISLAKAMARDLAKDKIRVNSLAPGSIMFPGGGWDRRRKSDPEWIADFIRRDFPFGRMGTVEEVAAAAVFLLSPRSSWVAGACLTVDGAQSRAF